MEEPGRDPGQGPEAGNEQDPQVAGGQITPELDADDPFNTAGEELEFGAGVTPGQPPAPATPTPPVTPQAPAFDPTNIDLLRLDLSKVPEGERGMWGAVQTLGRNLQGGTEKAVQDLNAGLERLDKFLQGPGGGQPQGQPGTGALPAVEPSQYTAQTGYLDPGEYGKLGPADRAGLSVFLQAAMNMVAPYLQHVQSLTGLQETVTGIQQSADQKAQAEINAEIESVRAKYPSESIDTYKTAILQQMGILNPGTGKYYTADQAYRMQTGKSLEEAEQLSAEEKALRLAAQNGARPGQPGAAPQVDTRTGQPRVLTEEQGLAEAARLLREGI